MQRVRLYELVRLHYNGFAGVLKASPSRRQRLLRKAIRPRSSCVVCDPTIRAPKLLPQAHAASHWQRQPALQQSRHHPGSAERYEACLRLGLSVNRRSLCSKISCNAVRALIRRRSSTGARQCRQRPAAQDFDGTLKATLNVIRK